MRDQVERLLEISPAIPEFIQNKYRKQFKDISGVAHPQIIGGLHKVIINKQTDIVIEEDNAKNIMVRSTPTPIITFAPKK
jgi:hypothetical protein